MNNFTQFSEFTILFSEFEIVSLVFTTHQYVVFAWVSILRGLNIQLNCNENEISECYKWLKFYQ